MSTPETTQRHWNSLLKRLREEFAPPDTAPAPEPSPLVDLLVLGTLTWEASSSQASAGRDRLRTAFVDLNEVRVSMPDDICASLGERYPLVDERAMRMRTMLNDLFRRQHSVSLEHLRDLPKRDARMYLQTLEGCPEYAAAFVVLKGLGGHALPADDRLTHLLIKEHVLAPESTAKAAASWVEHYVHADEMMRIHQLLQAWSDRDGHAPRREKRTQAVLADGAPTKPPPREPKAKQAAADRGGERKKSPRDAKPKNRHGSE